MSLCAAVDFVIHDLGYREYLMEYGRKYGFNIEDLENIIQEFRESVLEHKSISDFLEHVSKVEDETKKSKNIKDENRVTLSTVHGVKGMEFKNIFIINLVDGNIPYEHNHKMNIEEERRLFYVGVTRAIDNITFLSPKFIRGDKKNKSIFLNECNIEEIVAENNGIEKGNKVIHKTYGLADVIEVGGNSITLLFPGDIERRFDLSILLQNSLITPIAK